MSPTTLPVAMAQVATNALPMGAMSSSDQGGNFGAVMAAGIAELDGLLKTSERQSLRLASGEAESLHRVVLDQEQARIAFQFAVQLRNRLIEGWQELQRMQL
jgi:flagellar hook-basal body complex protein FliE